MNERDVVDNARWASTTFFVGYGLAIVAGVAVAAGWYGLATTLGVSAILVAVTRAADVVAFSAQILNAAIEELKESR
jgi:hypothetical protein